MNQVTVKKAFKRGHQMVNFPILAIMIIGFGTTVYLSKKGFNSTLVGILGGSTFILMWLWWSLQISRWKVWAFGNVRNVHELKRKAIEQQLIWYDGSWFNKTEIWTSDQKRKWLTIERKFQYEDEVQSIADDG